jgi:DMSO/TMAO reductase YedYZ molybdopterin-dependent catalytic subunit
MQGAPRAVRQRRGYGALAGLLAAAVALGVGELAAGVVGPASSPVVAVGNAVIALTPESVKHVAITTFGQDDKVALVAGTLVLVALFAFLVGLVALHRRRLGVLAFAVFGVIGAVAAVTRPVGGPVDALPSLVGAAAGVVALLAMLTPLTLPEPVDHHRQAADASPIDRLRAALGSSDRAGTAMDRRGFFVAGAVAVGVAVLTGGGGRSLQRRFVVRAERADLRLPVPASSAAALPTGADLAQEVHGVTPLFTANRDFYRIDTALIVPQVRPEEYRLTLAGMFDSPRHYTLSQLYRRDDLIERDITLTCVSNEVGGTLAGSARWLGVPLGAFLRENGVRPQSSQLLCRSVDGMTIGAPTRSALDVEDAMLAIGMNGEPLPVEHGFPVRMIIPGLYGYVSACKWLASIEATTYSVDAYWVQRGWAADGPIRIASRIDTPAPQWTFPAGRRPIAGVAWAQTRGISRVEVRVDGGPWTDAELAPAADADLWRQWVLRHYFSTGRHTVTVRATSGDGEVQPEARADPFPSGATGWHTTEVTAV